MPFWTYILECADGKYYVGHADDLEARIAAHQSGYYDGWTRKRLPVRLVFSESLESRDDAFALERQLKGWSRAKKAALIRGDMELLRQLARSAGSAHGSTSSPSAEILATDSPLARPPGLASHSS